MRKTDNNLAILRAIFVVALVISNVVTARLFYTGVELFGVVVTLPGAILCYPITYLATDIIGEIWGKREANYTVLYGFIGQITATVLIVATRYIPAADADMQDAYVMLLGQTVVFVVGSMVAYIVSQIWDVFIFHRIRERYLAKEENSPKARWLWNCASTMTSQIWDTVIFIVIAFGFGYGWLFDSAMYPTLAAMLVGQYVVKFLEAVIDTPFFYFFTRKRKEKTGAITNGKNGETEN